MTEVVARQEGAGEFWETEPGWVLLDCGDGAYLPFNQIGSTAMVICDDDESERVAARMRLAGCPVIAMPLPEGPPRRAEIYVDRVPQDALKVLVELRRLLRTGWRFSDLRDLLAAQPIRAGGHDLAKLRSALTETPHLRPYLFYDTRRRLVPVWPAT
ncbi:hypothetical protein KZZ52_49025 [Dactylosporangium sp. AC04546]|uniref:hypothetical protein n=1 Tax=Dactylosporangium sp. AC04546 TaxID=2862460 RepID=UPI001EDE499E|nr:hypothetical protein [Dactylosporangium sp. AC04546]WVK81832.1 hypothetical protein KZZ52_49025 [Dactylosporangium sp. AC04546]